MLESITNNMRLFLLPLHGQVEGMKLELLTRRARFECRTLPALQSARGEHTLLGQGRAALVLL